MFAQQTTKDLKEVNVAVQQIEEQFDGLKRIVQNPHLMYGGIVSVKGIIEAADSFGQYSSRLRQATSNLTEFKDIQNQLFDTSNRTFKSYEDATELFIRTSDALKQLGYDAQATADLVSTVQFGLTVDSADVQKTQSVINALSGAILEGKLDMQKFNSIVSASPSLFQALADSIAGGSQNALRQLVKDGKVTADELVKITQQMDVLGKRADEMPTTVTDAFTKLQNNFTRFVGEVNDSYQATQTLSSGISLLADNLDLVVAAGMGFTGIKFAEKTLEYAKALSSVIDKRQEDLRTAAQQAIKNQALAASNVQLALAELNAVQGTEAAAVASLNLRNARMAEAKATQTAETAQKQYAASLTVAGRALSFVGGPMGLLTLAVTAGATAWAYYKRDTDKAKQSIIDITRPVSELKEEYIKLGRAQRAVVLADLESKIAEKTEPATQKLKDLTRALIDGKWDWQAKEIRSLINNELRGILEDTTLTAAELDKKIVDTLEGWKTKKSSYSGTNLFSEKEIDNLNVLVGELVNAQGEVNKLHSTVKTLENSAKAASSNVKSFADNLIPKGMDKWDEYLKNLENARDVIGLNARELAEFQARQKGANDEQAKIAGIVSAQTEAYKDLQEAIRRKDSAAEAAALENIKNLDIENQRMSLLAQKVIEVAKLLEMVKSGAISAEMGDQLKKTIETTYSIASQHLGQSEQSKQIVDTIRTNTNPDIKKVSKSSGGSGGQSELQSLTKSLQEQYAVLGMTDLEAQKYKINMMQGSAAAKEYAISLAEKISRHKEEAETLKQNRALAEELSVFRDKTFLPLEMMGLGDFAREKMNDLIAVREEYAQKRRQLEENQESESTRISEEAYQARLQSLIESENQKLAIIEEGYQKRKDLESNWALGAAEALNNYAAEANNVYASMNNAVSNAFHGMEDALLDFVMTGKANFKDLANSIIRDLVRIYIQQQITGVFASALGGLFSGGSFSGIGNVGHSFTVGGSAPTGLTPIGPKIALATGGLVTGPGTATSDSIPAMLSNGEYVINAKATRQHFALLEAINKGRTPMYRANGGVVGSPPRIPTVSGLQAMSAPAGSVTVNITNQSSQPVGGNARMSMDSMGNMVVDVMLEDLNKNGRYTQQLKSMMGK